MDFVLDQKARGGIAYLARIVEDAVGRALRRRVQIGRVGEHDVRRLAAAFQGYDLHVRFGRIFQEQLSDFGRSGEGERVHVGMPAQRLARRLAKSRHHVEHARRDASFRRQLGDAQRGQRRLLGGLEHHAIAGRQSGREFPGRHEQGKIPRHNGADHAQRLACDERQRGSGRGRDLVIALVDGLAVPAHAFGHRAQIPIAGIGNRLAHVEGFEQRQLIGVFGDQLGEAHEHALARFGRLMAPASVLEGGAGGRDGKVDVGSIAGGDAGEQYPAHRRNAVEGLAAGGVHEFAADKGLVADGEAGGFRPPIDAGVHVCLSNCRSCQARRG